MHLYLLRHGESYGNATGDYSLLESDSLSERGCEQAQKVAEALSLESLDRIVVSPLLRATQTIFPYLEKSGQTAEIWPELAEIPWRGEREPVAESWPTEPPRLPEEMAHRFVFWEGNPCKPAPGESIGQGLRRVVDAEARLRKLYDEGCQSLLMVSHGHFLRKLLNLILKTEKPLFYHHRNVGFSRLIIEDNIYCNGINLPIDDISVGH
ncbi:MAG: histidine phosphatase family protein [Opitutales bacterium]|nr:histidine phosphatase family protein [Opitutales bacterium]